MNLKSVAWLVLSIAFVISGAVTLFESLVPLGVSVMLLFIGVTSTGLSFWGLRSD